MTLARLVVVAVLAGTSAVPFALLFGGRAHLVPLAGAVLVPCVVGGGLALAAPRVAVWARRAVTLLLLSIPMLLLTGTGADVVDGPARLLTAALPLQPDGPELAVAVLAVGVTALASTELALRPARPALAAAVPAAVCFTAGLALGASGPRPPAALAAALVAGGGALLALDAGRGHRAPVPGGPRLVGAGRTSRRTLLPRLAVVTSVVAAATVLASLLGPWTPGASARGRPFDARDLVAAPVVPRTSVSPLADLPVLRSGPVRTLFTVHTGSPGLVRAATLTQFDGHLWTTGGTYRRAGQVLPAPPAGRALTVRSRMRVEVADPAAVTWLPTGGRAVRVSVAGLGVDPAAGDLVVPAGQHAPGAYTVTSAAPDIERANLSTGVYAPHERALPTAAAPPALTRLRAAADAVAGTRDTAFEQVAALSQLFHRGFQALRAGADGGAGAGDSAAAELHQGAFALSRGPDAPAGHGLSQIDELLSSGRGTAEQYASAFAVLARQLGYDARVVVGYRVRGDRTPSGRYELTNQDVHAWGEVRMLGVGWVAFDVTPRGGGTSGGDERDPADGAPGQADKQAGEVLDDPADAAGGDRLPAAPPASGGGLPWRPLAALAAALALTPVLAAAVLPLAGAAVRRRRRRLPDPARRVAGAWQEALDQLAEHGLPVTRAMTSGEVAKAGSAMCAVPGTAGLADLARIVDGAGYGPDAVDDARATVAWQLSDRLRRALTAQLPRQHRVLRLVDPRLPARRWAAVRRGQRMRRIENVKRPSMK